MKNIPSSLNKRRKHQTSANRDGGLLIIIDIVTIAEIPYTHYLYFSNTDCKDQTELVLLLLLNMRQFLKTMKNVQPLVNSRHDNWSPNFFFCYF